MNLGNQYNNGNENGLAARIPFRLFLIIIAGIIVICGIIWYPLMIKPIPTPTRFHAPTHTLTPFVAMTDTPTHISTLTATSTGTPPRIPTLTATSTGTPPRIPTPTATSTGTPTRILRPTATTTGTPTSTPTLTATPSATLTVTPSPTPYPVPILDDVSIIVCNVTFRWGWPGVLAEDEWFAVRVWREGIAPAYSITWTKERQYTYPLSIGGDYSWEIAVCRGKPETGVCEQLAVSEQRKFEFGGCSKP